MKNIKDLHKKAMEFADSAEVGKLKGMSPQAIKENFYQAYLLEKEAALKMSTNQNNPIPRSYLLRSAAALAYRAAAFLEAEKMIALGLSENPPLEVIQQLEELTNLIKKSQSSIAENKAINLKGKLLAADEKEFEIKIQSIDEEEYYSIFVPANILKGIVRKYFAEMVNVQAVSSPSGFIKLEDISLAA